MSADLPIDPVIGSDGAYHHILLHLTYHTYCFEKKNCKVYLILVIMSPGNLLEIIPADLLHTLTEGKKMSIKMAHVCVCVLVCT